MAQAAAKKAKAPAARTSAPAPKIAKAQAARSSAAAPKIAKAPAARTSAPAPKTAKAPAARSSAAARKRTAGIRDAAARTAELSEEMLKSVEAGQRAAIEAVRKFVDTVDEVLPALGDRPSRRETVIDAALEMADRLVKTQYDFLRSAVHSAGLTLGEPGATKT